MPAGNALPWILGGGAAAIAVYYWQRDRDAEKKKTGRDTASGSSVPAEHTNNVLGNGATDSSSTERRGPLPGRWVWPAGVWQGRKPEISDDYSSKRRTPSGQVVGHGGVDLMYRRRPEDPWRAGTPNGTRGFVMPDRRAALAASDGVVSFAANTPRGWSVIIDHAPRKLATYYTHLSSLLVVAKQKVSAGTPIGVIGADPLDGQHIMHLHFETWRGGVNDRFDPQPLILAGWEYLPDPGDQGAALVARNAQTTSAHSTRVPVRAHSRSWPRHGI